MTGIMFICDADTKVELADSKLSLDNRCILLSDMEYDNGLAKKLLNSIILITKTDF